MGHPGVAVVYRHPRTDGGLSEVDGGDVAALHLYRAQQQEFPAECREADYEKRIKDAYPIHPEVFDRLYTDWSALGKFQRTRGVLRLMAAVIHHLWERGDRSPLILPGSIALEDARIQSELTRYLDDNWTPIIEKMSTALTRCRCGSTATSRTWESSPPVAALRGRFSSVPLPLPELPSGGSTTGVSS